MKRLALIAALVALVACEREMSPTCNAAMAEAYRDNLADQERSSARMKDRLKLARDDQSVAVAAMTYQQDQLDAKAVLDARLAAVRMGECTTLDATKRIDAL